MIDRRTVVLTAPALSVGAAATAQAAMSPVATTAHGVVRGTEAEGGIKVFKAIPYAQARRFMAPTAPTAWAGVRDALAYGPMSPQAIRQLGSLFASWTFDKEYSEDCQILNVWTPGLRDNARRPVMVWLHGGGFASLSGSRNVFDGTRLCRKGDVVVVTLNHRLNSFGYLQLAQLDPAWPDAGNAGMLDIVAALRWVRDNIAEFGGDPSNVTIFGQSGGGAKVTNLMAMPAARGLFHRAIVQSGSYYLQAMTADQGTRLAIALLEAAGLTHRDVGKLATMPVAALVAATEKASAGPARANFQPVIDGRNLPSGPFAPGAPALSDGIPLMVGTTATEMTLLTGAREPATFSLTDADLRRRLGAWFQAGDIDTVIRTFRATRPNATPSDIFFAVSTDKTLREGAWWQAERKAARKAAPVWLYELDWVTPVDGGKWGSPHSLDLAMVFDNVGLSASMTGTGIGAQRVADQMSATWLAFARTGRPNNPTIPFWPAYREAERATMVFNVESRVINDFRGDERTLLSRLKPPA